MAGDRDSTFAWRNPGVRRSVAWLVVLTVVCLLVGFLWLPSVHADFRADGLWASICRAAGVPTSWSGGGATARAIGRSSASSVDCPPGCAASFGSPHSPGTPAALQMLAHSPRTL